MWKIAGQKSRPLSSRIVVPKSGSAAAASSLSSSQIVVPSTTPLSLAAGPQHQQQRQFAHRAINSNKWESGNLPDLETFVGKPLVAQQHGPLDCDISDYEDVVRWPNCKITGLENGLRIATENLPWNSNTVSIGVFIDAGSRYETEENNGSAHFLEHLAFKGTGKRTREQLEMEVEDLGGHLNAYTSREQTVYYAQVLRENTNEAVDILSDILCNSLLDEQAIERERSVILQEMENVYSETKEELIFDHLHENCFQDCALGRTILGPVDNIKRITRKDLLEYINTYYTADNMVVVATGCIPDHDAFVAQVAEKFSGLKPSNQRKPAKDVSYFRGCEYDERWDDMEYVYMALAYETCPWNDADTYPLMFMQQMLGQWDKKFAGGQYSTSGLVRYCYADASRPVAENFMAFNTPYTDMGLFGVYACLHPYDFKFFLEATRREMNRFGYDVTEAQVDDVREKLKTTMLLAMGNTSQVMEMIGREILVHGRRIHPTEAFTRVNDVDVNAIKYAAHRHLIDKDYALAAVGPTHEFPYYTIFRRYHDKCW
eukprot:CAMPEP_0202691746 /NCGR_PEP_ID=MMETSP1385-20130828/6370_1 /ASSEMBLY_ACC=CAM_ASM_000861 /TAXON_ID=933848 /ORGANISM="Elphidium margaritaceum" /LENGTH=543 /DNA_ID=CAMNT_0049347193 /DNA_START=94 /DNA_END=1725 /DNA_ORIENTATION=-